MEFRVLGPVEVIGDGGIAVKLPYGRARVVIALLCTAPGQVIPRDRIIDVAWNETPSRNAVTQLHGYISELRRAFGRRDLIQTQGDGYALRALPEEVDLMRMRALIRQARDQAGHGQLPDAASGFKEALGLWRGRPFRDLAASELDIAANLIEEEYLSALEEYARVELRLGNHTSLIVPLAAAAGQQPLREQLHASLIRALARSGRTADAIAAYHELRTALAEDLGVDPNPELQDLFQRLLSGDREVRGSPVVRPAQLPPDLADFTGRSRLVTELCAALEPAGLATTVVVTTICGIGGIGKTALAVHAAHLAAGNFPGGELYADLAGTSADPAAPADVLARLLRDLGIPAEDIPVAADERTARYRSILAGRKVLVVLDDARDAAQVRPLLPGSAGCAVVVTSRARMADLAGAKRFDLPELEPDEGRELFAGIVGSGRVAAEPAATGQILRSCAGLPLAIRIAAARLSGRPGWSVASMAAKLAADQDRLAELRYGDMAVRSSFLLSHSCLAPAEARAFGLLGLAPPGVFELAAAAALLGVSPGEAEPVLDALTDAHMLEAPRAGWYRLHDLLRLFASEFAATEHSDAERDRATRRLVTWYAATIRSASRALPSGREAPPGQDGDGVPLESTVFASYRQALGWCQAAEPVLLWAIRTAAERGWDDIVVLMACHLWDYYVVAGNPRAFETTQRLGVASALRLGDEPAYATLQNGLGGALIQQGNYAEAVECFGATLTLCQRDGDRSGEAGARSNLAIAYQYLGRYAESLEESERVMVIAGETGDQVLLGVVANNAADACYQMGDLEGALVRFRDAVKLSHESGDRHTEGMALTGLGETLRAVGRLGESLDQHRLALAVLGELGTGHREQIAAMDRLSATLADMGRVDDARRSWTEALLLAESVADEKASELRARLESLDQAPIR
ncbi:MAG: BTAD domain-containing putative transcriptional regulator [Streptosporangiaceae bacterium]